MDPKLCCDAYDRQGAKNQVKSCCQSGTPFIQVKKRHKYATVHYDLITFGCDNGDCLSLEGYKKVYLLYWVYCIPVNYRPGLGRVVGFLNYVPKEYADKLARRLYEVLIERENRASDADDIEFFKAINQWEKEIEKTTGVLSDETSAKKEKNPLISIGWDTNGATLIKSPPLQELMIGSSCECH